MIKTEERIKRFEEHGVRFLDELPEGWHYVGGATTTPNGWRWAGHGSFFPGLTYEHA